MKALTDQLSAAQQQTGSPGLVQHAGHSRRCAKRRQVSRHTAEHVAPVQAAPAAATVPAKSLEPAIKRVNPMTDKFQVHKFHHIEWWCMDAVTTSKRFGNGLGMHVVAKSDQSTGNTVFASYVLRSHDMVFAFTSPLSRKMRPQICPLVPMYKRREGHNFAIAHGLGVRAVGIEVDDAEAAMHTAWEAGASIVRWPVVTQDEATGTSQCVAEVQLYGDVTLRFVSGSYKGPFLAGFERVDSVPISYGIQRVDHAVGNVHDLQKTLDRVKGFTGFHEFAEFTAADVGTVDSGLNSTVLASNNEMVILPINEPTFGTPRKSQIQTFLEQNEGEGLQHLALKTDDIFATMRALRSRSGPNGGFDFMKPASKAYYQNLPHKIGDVLTPEQYQEVEELGLLVDKDDQGVLLQIFTQPLSDRPTVFLEIIQRIGCTSVVQQQDGTPAMTPQGQPQTAQAGGCGGFGKGNFTELFKSIEDYERTLTI